MLADEAVAVAAQFAPGMLQITAFGARSAPIVLASFVLQFMTLAAHVLHVTMQFTAGDVGLSGDRQGQSGGEGEGNQLDFHGFGSLC
jgi:hypothetical protein